MVRERAVHDGVRCVDERHTVAALVRAVESTVQDVSAQGLLGLDERLSEVLRIGGADADVVAVLDKHLGERERQTINLVQVTLDEEDTAGLVRNGHAVG